MGVVYAIDALVSANPKERLHLYDVSVWSGDPQRDADRTFLVELTATRSCVQILLQKLEPLVPVQFFPPRQRRGGAIRRLLPPAGFYGVP